MKQQLHKFFSFALTIIILIALSNLHANAQAGTIDLSFGDSGKAFTTHGNFRAIALQQDNKIILAGKSYGNSKVYIATYRYKPNGSIDSAYGNNGVTKTSFNGYTYEADGIDIAVQQDGKIVVVGNVEKSINEIITSKSVVLRFLKDGTPDSSFGNNGSIFLLDQSSFSYLSNVIIQPDNKIICAGWGAVGNNQ